MIYLLSFGEELNRVWNLQTAQQILIQIEFQLDNNNLICKFRVVLASDFHRLVQVPQVNRMWGKKHAG